MYQGAEGSGNITSVMIEQAPETANVPKVVTKYITQGSGDIFGRNPETGSVQRL